MRSVRLGYGSYPKYLLEALGWHFIEDCEKEMDFRLEVKDNG